ncbi:MFS multidrug transporter [Myriangium duriaei CBS 260.36]|uniref:MFS multidrug transporter n=1 Tax=Myriangium duriaei CBS 260.36 TaxID=1168546 RepID=A0A9P4IYQ6_9PEZI|nr:MFS multidrug transporter [Myriangium duriaei CBS 260.36]
MTPESQPEQSPAQSTSTFAPTSPPYTIFDSRQRAVIVTIVSFAATFSGFASNIYFPVLPNLAENFNVSIELINLTVTAYLIFQALAPSLWGPISDVKGRRVAYCCTFLVFLGACIGLALSRNYATLVVLRCLQSTGSASTIAIGAGVIGDITTRDNRGGYMGIFQAGLLTPVAIGPVIGGGLAGALGWRAIFWFLAIYCAAFLAFLIVALPETLRSIIGNGSLTTSSNPLVSFPLNLYQKTTRVGTKATEQYTEPAAKKSIDFLGPFRVLIMKDAAPLIIFVAVHYAVWQMSITAMSTLFNSRYGLSETQIGLTFIANGVGSIVGTFITGKILDVNYRRLKAKAVSDTETGSDEEGTVDLKAARLQLVPVFSLVQCASILVFGWTINYPHTVPIAIPIITTFVSGWTAISNTSVIMTYVVDIFPDQSAAASASVNLARCLLAAGGTSLVGPMIDGINTGWTFTICIGVQFVALVAVAWQTGMLRTYMPK